MLKKGAVAKPADAVTPEEEIRFPSYCPMVAFSLVRPKSRPLLIPRRRAESRAPSCQFITDQYDNRWSRARCF
jgi:hypothetical protein